MGRVDVVLCTFNGASFLDAQLQSLARQTRAVDRVIVNDDGSTDGTLDVIDGFAGRLPVDLVRNEKRLGVTGNFQRALSRSTADVVFLCDQDDIWHPEKVQLMLDFASARPDEWLFYSDARIVGSSGEDTGARLSMVLGWQRQRVAYAGLLQGLLRRNLVTGATVALRSELLRVAIPFPEGYLHDEWLALVAASLGRIQCIEETLIDYRVHGGNQSGLRAVGAAARWRAMLSVRGDYHATRARKLVALNERLARVQGGVESDVLQAIRECRSHWETRAALPPSRWQRLPSIASELATRRYWTYSSGWRSALRDLAEPLR